MTWKASRYIALAWYLGWRNMVTFLRNLQKNIMHLVSGKSVTTDLDCNNNIKHHIYVTTKALLLSSQISLILGLMVC